MNVCPCGSLKDYSECCGPYHQKKASPKTAVALMRARYSAFVVQEFDFIFDTHHTSTLKLLDKKGVRDWSQSAQWHGLDIIKVEEGGEQDDKGMVEFCARFNMGEKDQYHRERSTFLKENNQWYFVDGNLVEATVKRESPKIGRNDLCSCGSQKKYKKCCALKN